MDTLTNRLRAIFNSTTSWLDVLYTLYVHFIMLFVVFLLISFTIYASLEILSAIPQ